MDRLFEKTVSGFLLLSLLVALSMYLFHSDRHYQSLIEARNGEIPLRNGKYFTFRVHTVPGNPGNP